MDEEQGINRPEDTTQVKQNVECESSTTSWMNWQYDFSKKMKLRYAVDVAGTNPFYADIFVKSIRMSPNGCSFLYSTEDGMIRYIDLRSIDFWGCEEVKEDHILPETLSESHSFSHTEIVYGMDWFDLTWEIRDRIPRLDTECFISCCKDTPIRLWDVATGSTSNYISIFSILL